MKRGRAGDRGSFGVNVGVHQGSVLSPLLFDIIMDAVARDRLPWETLYTYDLFLMAPSRKELRKKLKEYRRCLVGKGQKVNSKKSKVMPAEWYLSLVHGQVECVQWE